MKPKHITTERATEIKLYNKDCMVGMKEFDDNYFDLAVVDPPYGISNKKCSYSGGGIMKRRNANLEDLLKWDNAPDDEYFKELFRVSKNQIIWGGNYFALPRCRCFIYWDKKQPFQNFSQVEYAWTSFNYPALLYSEKTMNANRIHPTQKPVGLYKFIFNKFLPNGGKVLDTHLGSASSVIAFLECNYKDSLFVGYEISEEYMSKAVQRIKIKLSQKELF